MFVSAVIFCSLKVLFLPTFALTNMLPLFNYGLHTNRTYAINTPKFFSAPKTSLLKLAVAKHKGAIKTPALRDKSFNWPTNPSLHTSLPRAGRKLGWWLNGNMRNLSEHLFSADQVGEEISGPKPLGIYLGLKITTRVQKCLYSTPNSTFFLCPMVVLPDQNDQVKNTASNTRQF